MSKKWGNKKVKKVLKETDSNYIYNRAKKFSEHVQCVVCMGPCGGSGPYRANKFKRNCGKKPKYKDKRKSWGRD